MIVEFFSLYLLAMDIQVKANDPDGGGVCKILLIKHVENTVMFK